MFRYIQTGILDYLREGFSLACPAIQTYGVHVVYTHTFGCEHKFWYGSFRGDPYYGSGVLT